MSSDEGIDYRVLGIEDKMDTLDILYTCFIKDETQCRSLGVTPEDVEALAGMMMQPVLTCGMSIGAFDKGKLIGIRVTTVKTPNSPVITMDIDDPKQHKIAVIQHHVTTLYEGIDVFRETGQEEIVNFMCLAVRPEYRRRGIAGRLVEEALAVARINGFRAALVEASSNHAKRIFDRLNFKQISAVKLADFRLNGEVVFRDTYPHEWFTLHILTW